MKNLGMILGLGLMMGTSTLHAEDAQGPHGGILLSQDGQNVEFSVDASKKRVQVYVLKRTKDFPGAIEVSLKDQNGKSRKIQLKSIDPNRDPLHYYTSVTGGSQSYVGFEIRIPFRKEPPMVLKSDRGFEIK